MQTVERPRFRQDLVAELIEDGAARFIDVADPDSGQLFRFYEVEYSLACAMDGERDVAGIVRWAEEELGLKPSAQEVRTVIATLGGLGYLDSGKAQLAAVNAAAAAEAPEVHDEHEAQTVIEPVAAAAARAATPEPARPVSPATRPKTPPAGTPSRKPDVELERGVVAARSAAASKSAGDVELGVAGARQPARGADLPSGGDFELGAPGAAAAKPAAARGAGSDIALGASGAGAKSSPGLSTDLAADMAISPADVKEAVRASQVMKSVDVPPELAAELEPPKPVAKPAEAPAPVAARPDQTPARKPAVPRADLTPSPKPIEMPTERPVLPKAPPAPAARTSPILIALLVLVVLGAGAFAVYKFVLKKDTASQKKAEAPVQPKAPEPPPPPPVETAKLAVEQPAPEEIKPSDAATIATIVASDTAVAAGDPIARFVGYKPIETQVETLTKQVETAKAAVEKTTNDRDAAQTAGNKAGVTAAETKLATQQKALATSEAALATKVAALDKLVIKAPAAGKVTAVAKANAKVTPTDIIATLTRDPMVVATFKSAGEVAPETRVLLAIKGSEQKLSCTVVASGGDGTKIACPQDAAPEGTEVSYAGVDPSAPAPSETTPDDTGSAAAPTDEGSADGSAAEAAPEAPAEKAAAPAPKKAAPRPRPQPKKAAPPADKPAGDTPPAETPAEPAPAGSGA